MFCTLNSNKNPIFQHPLRIQNPSRKPCLLHRKVIHCSSDVNKSWSVKNQLMKPIMISHHEKISPNKGKKLMVFEKKLGFFEKGNNQMMVILCGFGYWVNGFRCFPWLALNFHMVNNLNMCPSTMQLVQNFANLPMVAKPLYGVLSDAIYIGGAHRLPYIAIGVLLQVFSWGPLALMPFARESLPALMGCVLVGNLGASIAEVAKDALVSEYGQRNKIPGLQSYAFMALAAGGILGNLVGGFFLLRINQTKSMFLAFASILALQFILSLSIKEESLGLPRPANSDLMKKSISESVKKQYNDLMEAVKEKNISRPLIWIVMSIVAVPVLSGSIFCYQTQCLNLDSSVIGMSRVTGQLMLLSMTALYGQFGKNIPMRKLVWIGQVLYAFSLLLDLVLVKQINLKLGISNEVFAFCFSGVAETLAQFKPLPFYVLFSSLAPSGCEGSLMSLIASALIFSSIFSGILGVGLASFLGITSGDYSGLPLGIMIQFIAALLPLQWINHVPASQLSVEKQRKGGRSKRTRRNRRVGRLVFDPMYSYRRERKSDLHI